MSGRRKQTHVDEIEMKRQKTVVTKKIQVKPKMPIIEDPVILQLVSFISARGKEKIPIQFTIKQIYTNSSRMYCQLSQNTMIELFNQTFKTLEESAQNDDRGFFPFKRDRLNQECIVIKFTDLKQIDLLKDENETYGYRTNVDVIGDVVVFPYYNYPNEENYGVCVKLLNDVSLL